MAFTDNVLFDPPAPGPFLGAGAEERATRLFDYTDGPIALQDNTSGMQYQQWRAYLEDEVVYVEADNLAPFELLNTLSGAITDISIAFNQNSDLNYAWVQDGVARLHYFDTITSTMQTMVLPVGIRTPKVTLDDKRAGQFDINDVVLSYVGADDGLYFRLQRERFTVERLLDPGPFNEIERMYMNEEFRLQWRITRKISDDTICNLAI